MGNGIRVEKGGEIFSKWPQLQQDATFPKAPRPAVEFLTHYFRYVANLARLNREGRQVACIIRSADLLAPMVQGGLDYDLSALASLIRDWASESLLVSHSLASFLIAGEPERPPPADRSQFQNGPNQDCVAGREGVDSRILPHGSAVSNRSAGVQPASRQLLLISLPARRWVRSKPCSKPRSMLDREFLPTTLCD